MGWVLHNWADDKAAQILKNIKSAMSQDSVLLINEMVVPETGAPTFPAVMDMVMLGVFRSRERTFGQWKSLLENAGLSVHHHVIYDPLHYNSIIEARLK